MTPIIYMCYIIIFIFYLHKCWIVSNKVSLTKNMMIFIHNFCIQSCLKVWGTAVLFIRFWFNKIDYFPWPWLWDPWFFDFGSNSNGIFIILPLIVKYVPQKKIYRIWTVYNLKMFGKLTSIWCTPLINVKIITWF